MRRSIVMVLSLAWLAAPTMPATAQQLGVFRWQLQPFCNIVSLTVTQVGGVYRLEGTDDRCGLPVQASVIGTAFLNPDGSIGMGLNIVESSGEANPLSVRLTLSTLSGLWHDGVIEGAFTLTPGAGTGGSRRPVNAGIIPTAIRLQSDGGLLAAGALNTGLIPATGTGTRMMWHPSKAAFRAGHLTIPAWDDVNIGLYSVAFGLNTVAAGESSAAFGEETLANGRRSTALGYLTAASGLNALASGDRTQATGQNSQAFGQSTVASGPGSMAIGQNTRAIGAYSLAAGANAVARATSSVAIGNAEVADTAFGSFAFGDFSTLSPILADLPGQFKVRASNGVRFATNAAQTAGVQMVGNSSQWLQLSDVHSKDRFRELDGDDVLRRIAVLKITEWGYKAQDAAIRHIGPTAQDFHAAFGLGEDARYIGSLDADGVALAAVKALEARTRALQDENAALRERLERLERRLKGRQ